MAQSTLLSSASEGCSKIIYIQPCVSFGPRGGGGCLCPKASWDRGMVVTLTPTMDQPGRTHPLPSPALSPRHIASWDILARNVLSVETYPVNDYLDSGQNSCKFLLNKFDILKHWYFMAQQIAQWSYDSLNGQNRSCWVPQTTLIDWKLWCEVLKLPWNCHSYPINISQEEVISNEHWMSPWPLIITPSSWENLLIILRGTQSTLEINIR